MTTLVHEMVRTGTRYGLQSMCEGGGMGQRHHSRETVNNPRSGRAVISFWNLVIALGIGVVVWRLCLWFLRAHGGCPQRP